jgi:Tfp pilus assembly protein PilO
MTRTRQWSMGTAVLVLLILVGGWFLVVAPKHASADDLRASTTTQESTNLTLAAQVSMLKAQQAGLPAQEAKLALIRQHIPDNPALPSFIRSLSALSKASNVTLQTIAPAPPTASTSPAVAPSGTKPTGVVPQLQSVSLTINLIGTYANLELFLNKLETLKRSFLLTGVQMAPGSATATGTTVSSGPPILAVIISARVFDVSTIGLSTGTARTGSTSTGSTSTGSTATTAH